MHNKVSRFSVYLVLFISLVLQVTAVDYIKIFGAKPDLMLLAVIFFGLLFGGSIGLEAGLVAGLAKDILSLDVFGANTFTMALTGFAVGGLSQKFFKESKIMQTAIVFVFVIVCMLIHYTVNSLVSNAGYIRAPEYFFGLILPTSLYTSVLSMLIFPFLMHRFHLEEREEFL